jgi:hypothetical protein
MTNEDKPKQDYSALVRALSTPILEPTAKNAAEKRIYTSGAPGSLLVIQFCCKCKNTGCSKVFPLETGVRTVEPERVPEYVAEFARDFESRTIACPACHHEAEYSPQDVGHDILGE